MSEEREALEAIANELRGVAHEGMAKSLARDILNVLQDAGWRSPQPPAAQMRAHAAGPDEPVEESDQGREEDF